jgi:hypothetical protein
MPEIKTESMQKWMYQLSDEEIMQIKYIVGFGPDASLPSHLKNSNLSGNIS